MTVEARLADEDPRAVAQRLGELRDALAGGGEHVAVRRLGRRGYARRRAVVAENVAQDARPLPGRRAGLRRLDRRRHDVGPLVPRDLGQPLERALRGRVIALGLPALEGLPAVALDVGI